MKSKSTRVLFARILILLLLVTISICSTSCKEKCDGKDNDKDGKIDEGFPDTDEDGTADCVDWEECDGKDNNGDGNIDEYSPDTDKDGIADCMDIEECDGKDNDGDGDIDEDFPDEDEDGIADCVDQEVIPEECDGKDNDGDGKIDENFPDTDGDGIADCMDPVRNGGSLSLLIIGDIAECTELGSDCIVRISSESAEWIIPSEEATITECSHNRGGAATVNLCLYSLKLDIEYGTYTFNFYLNEKSLEVDITVDENYQVICVHLHGLVDYENFGCEICTGLNIGL